MVCESGMGQGNSSAPAGRGGPQQSSVPNNLPPLSFHRVRGDNVRLSRDASLARRVDSFCKGVAFSARPVRVDERVCLRFAELSTNWSGVVRFGFTSRDPSSLHALPKYACPDLTGKPGYWAKALAERFCEKDAVLHYYVTQAGDCYFGIDGEDKGLFFSGVETRSPLWALVDVYGNCTALQFVDPRATPPDAALRALRLDDTPPAPLQPRYPGPLAPLPLHAVRGRNVRWQESTGAAWLAPVQDDGDAAQGGYVFTARPLPPESTLLLQVAAGGAGLTLGLTSCDPAVLRADELPGDPDVLLDRREYWVVSGAACGGAARGDELAVRLTRGGELRLARNGQPPRTALHVDHTLRLYAFLHIACPDTKIRILGTPTPSPPPAPAAGAVASLVSGGARLRVELPLEAGGAGGAPPGTVLVVNLPPAQNHANHALHAAAAACLSPHQPQSPQPAPSVLAHHFLEALPPTASSSALSTAVASGTAVAAPGGGECTVCYERGVDSVLYACGHMCMCYRCAVQQWRGKGGGHCPLCRAPIRDVIRTYKS